jgi:hypothetical protein
MVAENQMSIISVSKPQETLVGLDFADGAPSEPLNVVLKVCPEDIPLPFPGNTALLLKIVTVGHSCGGVGVGSGPRIR